MTVSSPDPIGLALSGGRYTVTTKLGEGGMGTVYRAVDNHLQADVVIKLLHQAMAADSEFSRRFYDEVRSLVRLSHPHIVKVTDVGAWNEVPFAVLQFLPGGSLDDRLAVWQGPTALAGLASWLGPVGSALDYVHSQGMVHRDVKPGNILFDAQGHAFLGDFGVAKVLAAATDHRASRGPLTGTGMVLGTPQYMAPELIMGDPFDGRVDQYALAVTTFEVLCGRRPFEHEVATRVLMMHTQDQPPRLTSLCPWAPSLLDTVLGKGLAKNPIDRYPSCRAFATAVIEASGAAQTGRVRIRCGSCARTMLVPVETLAKLNRAQHEIPCPECGHRLDLGAGTTVTASVSHSSPSSDSPRAGTALLGVPGNTTDLAPPRLDGVSPPAPSGTVVFVRPRIATVVEPRPGVAPRGGAGEEHDDSVRSTRSRLLLGIAAAVVLIGGLTLLWALVPGRSNTLPAATQGIANAGRPDPAPGPTPGPVNRPGNAMAGLDTHPAVMPPPSLPQRPAPLVASSVSPPRVDTPVVIPIKPESSPLKTDNESEPRNDAAGPLPLVNRSPTRPSRAPSQPEATARPAKDERPGEGGASEPEAKPTPALVADEEKPSQRNVPLQRLLANPEAYAGQLITLEQVYCVGKTPWRLPDGSLQTALIESDLELTNTSARVRLGESFELGLDQGLADQLTLLGKMVTGVDEKPSSFDWIMQPANLTVKVADEPARQAPETAVRIVRLELFERFRNEVRGATRRKLIVLFETQTITAVGTSNGLGNNDEWQKVRKLGHAYNQFQRFFEGIQRQYSQQRWAVFNNQLNNLIVEGTKQSVAAQAATQRRLQQMSMPR